MDAFTDPTITDTSANQYASTNQTTVTYGDNKAHQGPHTDQYESV
jgi:hypothetical protein